MAFFKIKHSRPTDPPDTLSLRGLGFDLNGHGSHGVWAVVVIVVALFALIALAPAAFSAVLGLFK